MKKGCRRPEEMHSRATTGAVTHMVRNLVFAAAERNFTSSRRATLFLVALPYPDTAESSGPEDWTDTDDNIGFSEHNVTDI
jgi:hypothetical protein